MAKKEALQSINSLRGLKEGKGTDLGTMDIRQQTLKEIYQTAEQATGLERKNIGLVAVFTSGGSDVLGLVHVQAGKVEHVQGAAESLLEIRTLLDYNKLVARRSTAKEYSVQFFAFDKTLYTILGGKRRRA